MRRNSFIQKGEKSLTGQQNRKVLAQGAEPIKNLVL